mgnify:CR=1 FL=1
MIFLYVTCRNTEEAKKIGTELLKKRAVGWVNITPTHSLYRVGEEVKETEGATLLVKTVESKMQDVENVTRELHSHRVPCVAAFSLYRLNKEYKDWLIASVA